MNILDKIIIDKKSEVELKKKVVSVNQLEATDLFNSRTKSLSKILANSNIGIIAEHKRRSPSKSVINFNHTVEDVTLGYQNAGVCGISVLTDGKYFGGSLDDLILTKATVNIPVLRKEFIVVGYSVSKKEYTFYWAELTQWYVFYMKYIFEILSSQAIGSSENLIFKKIEDSNLIDKLTNEFKSPIKLIKDNCPGCNCSIDEKTLECPNCGLNLIIKG